MDLVKFWTDELEKAEQKDYLSRTEKIHKEYTDRRRAESHGKKLNIFWSGVSTMMPAIYSRRPKPNVSRRFKDKDPLGLQAAIVLERSLEYHVDLDQFHDSILSCREDFLLYARGVVKADYRPSFAKETVIGLDGESAEEERLVYEEVAVEYVYRKDFRHGKAKRWADVPWVAYRSFLTRKELTDRFKDGANVPLDAKEDKDEDEGKKGVVWEIWDKTKRKVYWIAPSYKEAPLDQDDPPLNLSGFFNCCPIYDFITNDSLEPIPDYTMYQDQVNEINRLTDRISSLTNAIRVAGLYDGAHPEIARLLGEGVDNQLIGVADWQNLLQKGGLDNAVSWFPIEQMVKALIQLYDARERVKQELYEVSGLSDIIRGQTDPRETLGAQRIKGQFANIRIEDKKAKFSRGIKRLLNIVGEIVAEHFQPETLQLMTGQEVSIEVIELLRNDVARSYGIDIETDSTVEPDEQADKQARVEFLTAVGGFMERVVPFAQQQPALTPVLGEMLLFGVRGFRAGRSLESLLEDSIEQLKNQPPSQEPSAEDKERESKVMKNLAEAQETQVDTEIKKAELNAPTLPI